MPAAFRLFCIVLAASCLFWCAGLAGFMVHLRGMPAPAGHETDAIVVLTGGPERINTGLDLLAAGRAEFLFISGVNASVTEEKLLAMWGNGGRAREDAAAPPCCIALGHRAANTTQNALETRAWAQSHGIDSIRLLTAYYHMPRALLEFRAALPGAALTPHPIRPKKAGILLIASEYSKTLYTFARIRITKPAS